MARRKDDKDDAVETPPHTRLIGYARVSTTDQNVQAQIDALLAAGVLPQNLHHESVSGAARKRPALDLAFLDARAGDTVVVWKLDRLGRNLRETLQRLHDLDERGIYFRSLSDSIDTSTDMGKAIGKLLIAILAAVAEFERELTRERTRHGIKRHLARGGRIGAPRTFTPDKVREARRLRREGKSWREVARTLGFTTMTVRKYLKPRKR